MTRLVLLPSLVRLWRLVLDLTVDMELRLVLAFRFRSDGNFLAVFRDFRGFSSLSVGAEVALLADISGLA